MPERVQRKRTKGWRLPDGAVIVDRTTKWGNPFVVGKKIDRDSPLWPYIAEMVPGGTHGLSAVGVPSKEASVGLYVNWFIEQPQLMLSLGEIRGRDLACWCRLSDPWCHVVPLLELANPTTEGDIDG